MNNKQLLSTLIILGTLLFWSCADSNTGEEITLDGKSLLILNEGSMGMNDATLARYNLKEEELIKDYFNLVNKIGLGDVANDMIQYGSKIYIVVSKSGTIEVIEAATGKSIRQIAMKTTGMQSKEPRRLVAHGGKIYVTSFDDTVTRIDTATLTIDGSLQVGMDPEGIIAVGNKLYVANSGGLNWENGYDKTVSVINIASFTEEQKIEVGTNPGIVQADSQGDVYLSVTGNYFDEPGAFKMIRSGSNTVETINGIEAPQRFVISSNIAYIITGSYGEPYKLVVYDCLQETIIKQNFISDGTEIHIINNVSVDSSNGDVFITSTDFINPGDFYCFDKTGKMKYHLSAIGINPSIVLIQE
jgi:hypothetical protein